MTVTDINTDIARMSQPNNNKQFQLQIPQTAQEVKENIRRVNSNIFTQNTSSNTAYCVTSGEACLPTDALHLAHIL
jgi:hypothetical protein